MNNNNTILIVDDSVTELKHLQNILEDAGYKVITASSGNQAIAITSEMKPDAVMLDVVSLTKAMKYWKKSKLFNN